MDARANLDFAIGAVDTTSKQARTGANHVEGARDAGVSDGQAERLTMVARQLMAISDMTREIATTLAGIDAELRGATAPEATPGG